MRDVILVRFGELSLKGLNRKTFENTLVNNIRASIGSETALTVKNHHGRIFIEHSGQSQTLDESWVQPAMEKLTRVFGIVSISAAQKCPLRMDSIQSICLDEMQQLGQLAKTFKVDTIRADKTFPESSPEVSRKIGSYILSNMPHLSVDLNNPDVTVSVEIRNGKAYVYSDVIQGPGGLPYGTGGKALLLLSGGIDSPVAGHFTMKRGVELEALHFYSYPFTSERSKDKVIDLCKILASYSSGKPINLNVVPFTAIQKAIIQDCPQDLTITIMRRMMLRIAEHALHLRNGLALVTGESIGQVASQTLESMLTINSVTSVPILRPLCGLDKTEIVNLARKIGTYDISIRPYEDCCTLFVPKHPKTKPHPWQAEKAEQNLGIDELVETAVQGIEIIEVY